LLGNQIKSLFIKTKFGWISEQKNLTFDKQYHYQCGSITELIIKAFQHPEIYFFDVFERN